MLLAMHLHHALTVVNNGKENQRMLTQVFVKGLLTKQWYPMPDKNSKFAEQAEGKVFKKEKERREEGNKGRKVTADTWAGKAIWYFAERIYSLGWL